MRLHADSYFHIGRSHYTAGRPCQDFAIARADDQSACAVVSDGCSTGGNTDVGARIIALATLRALRSNPEWLHVHQSEAIESAKTTLGLDRSDLLATCVWMHATEHILSAHVQGDGVIALKYKTGRLKAWRYEWTGNAPWYPIYTDSDYRPYIDSIHNGVEYAAQLQITEVWLPPQAHVSATTVSESLRSSLIPDDRPDVVENAFDLDFAAVFTDGVTQIEGVDWKTAVSNLLAFKTTTGEFAKRRMIREIHDAEKIGKGPLDDIAYAVIAFDRSGDLP